VTWPPDIGVTPYYVDDACVIYNADCSDILPLLPKVDLVLTDPPYEIVARGGGIGAKRKYLHDIDGFTDSGFDIGILGGFDRWMVFCGLSTLRAVLTMPPKRWCLLTWNKPNPTPLVNGNYLPDTEYIVHSFPSSHALHGSYSDRSRFILYPCGNKSTDHPNEKPIAVMKRLVSVGSTAGEIVLDPFCGSGSTLRASKDLGRKSIGIELEEKWCRVAVERLKQEVLAFPEARP